MNGQVTKEKALPFAAPCNKLPAFAAFQWLKLGWQDFKLSMQPSAFYGILFILISYGMTAMSWYWGGAILLISLLSGFVFLAPVLAIGLYSISYQVEAGFDPKLSYSFREGRYHMSNIAIFSFVMLIVFLVWVRAGSAVHIFAPVNPEAKLSSYFIFFGIGSAIGSVFAFVVFCASAFSLPMMLDRKADAITAAVTSFNAVLENKLALLIWAITIGICLLVCLMTGFVAMFVLMPVLGYASWHGYKQTIDATQWPENRKLNDRHPGKRR